MTTSFTTASAPGALPGAGHAVQLLRRPLPFLASLPRHGDLVRIRLGPQTAYVPCHPEVLRLVAKNDHVFDKGGPFYDRTRETIGNALATAPCAEHRRQRRIVQPSFDHRRIEDYAPVMTEEVTALTDAWSPQDVVDIGQAMERLTLRVLLRTLFGLSPDHRAIAEVERSLPVLVTGVYRRLFIPERILTLAPSRLNRDYGPARTRMWQVTENLIREGRRQSSADRDDLLSVLLGARHEQTGEPLTDQEVFDQIITMLTSGMETAAKALGFTFYLLGRHPEVQDRLRGELQAVLPDRPPEFKDVAQLPYTRQVILESLRLYPPVWLFSRVTTAETTLTGRRLPAGTNLLISPYVLHHNPTLFEDPEKFDPDRWLPERARTTPRGALVPFGLGPRKCVGDQFALVEMAIIVAAVVSRWRLWPAPGWTFRPRPRATLSPGPLPMTLRPVQ